MSADDRVRWDEVFRLKAQAPYPAPDPLLLQLTPAPTREGARGLDLCGGLGQNGLWLAEQGYLTDILDISRVALQRARQEMASRNLRNVNLLQVDVDELALERSHYDVVCVFRYLRRDLFPKIAASVAHGGRIIYETYNMRYLEKVPEFNRSFLLYLDELPRFFEGWQTLYFEEHDHTTRYVGLKP
jgi:SAM-dependent methyltransferase